MIECVNDENDYHNRRIESQFNDDIFKNFYNLQNLKIKVYFKFFIMPEDALGKSPVIFKQVLNGCLISDNL